MWQTKYALALPKNLGVRVDFWPFSEDKFLSGCPRTAVVEIVLVIFV